MLLVTTLTVLSLCQLYLPLTGSTDTNTKKNACTRFGDYPLKEHSPDCYENPNVLSSTVKMIRQSGYDVQEHDVVTGDGYKSRIFRIPVRDNDNRKNKQPVVLQHGVLVNSAVWTWAGNRSLAFVLANAGYDVWLANQRDSGYTTHKTYKTSDYNFWSNSLDTVAAYDVPAILNTVALATNKSGSIIYIGHSRGSTVLFMYACEHPEEAQKLLAGFIAIAPIVYLEPVSSIRIISQNGPFLGEFFQTLRTSVFFYPTELTVNFFQILCTNSPYVCLFIVNMVSGRTSQFSPEDLLAYFSIYPGTVSVMQLLHYSQLTNSGNFQKFDYGREENLLRYKQEKPSLYNLSNFKLPTYMFYGKQDVLLKEEGVKKIFQELGSSEKGYFKVPSGTEDDKWQFGHSDFVWSRYVEESFYKDLFKILDKLQAK